jgi:two-component system CheB/CheR fusion protein
VSDLTHANDDLNNLVAGTGIATLFLDSRLRIGRFTPGATAILNLLPGDVGRPLAHVVSNIVGYDRVIEDAQAVLDTLVPTEVEVQTRTGTWYLLGVRPYRTIENVVEGVVLTFTDTTEMRRKEAIVQEAEGLRRLAAVVRDAGDAIVVHDNDGGIVAWNPRAALMLGWTEAETETMNLRDLVPGPPQADAPRLTDELARAALLQPQNARWIARDGRVVDVSLVATALLDADGAQYAIATTVRERTNSLDAGVGDRLPEDVTHA